MGKKAIEPEDITGVVARANPRWSTQYGAHGRCYDASYRLQCVLIERGHIDAKLIDFSTSTGDHWAVELDGTVYDLTIRQFSNDKPFPWITTKQVWLQYLSDRLRT